MGLFSKNKSSLMDVIRCDETDYLIWKWRPQNGDENRANSIRWGSSLRVKDGSLAIFVYKQGNGIMQDYIEGPYDGLIETNNLPVFAEIIGTAYNGASPLQAEVYFVNLAGLIQIKFAVPYFDIFDPRFPDYGVPVAVRGAINFKITDYMEFISLHRLDSFNLDDFKEQVKYALSRYVKETVMKAPEKYGIPVVQIEKHIEDINNYIEANVTDNLKKDFGVTVTRTDISAIEIDKDSPGFKKLSALTTNKAATIVQAVSNLKTASKMGKQGSKNLIRTAKDNNSKKEEKESIGDKVSGIFSKGIGIVKQNSGATPPPIPVTQYYIAVGSKQAGPFDLETLKKMAEGGSFSETTLVWKEGMKEWKSAKEVDELSEIFSKSE